MSIDVGSKIRKIRLQEQMTLQELAQRCGCSKSMLSKIENSVASPSIATLSKISKALGIKMCNLLDESNSQTCVFTSLSSLDDDSFIKSNEGYRFAPLAANFVNNSMTPLLIRGKIGEVIKHELVHNGEEFVMVLKGELIFQVGNTEYKMKEKDCIYFNSTEKHGMIPLTETVEYLDVVL